MPVSVLQGAQQQHVSFCTFAGPPGLCSAAAFCAGAFLLLLPALAAVSFSLLPSLLLRLAVLLTLSSPRSIKALCMLILSICMNKCMLSVPACCCHWMRTTISSAGKMLFSSSHEDELYLSGKPREASIAEAVQSQLQLKLHVAVRIIRQILFSYWYTPLAKYYLRASISFRERVCHMAAHHVMELILEALEAGQKLLGLPDKEQQPLHSLFPQLAGLIGLLLVELAPRRDHRVRHRRQIGPLCEAVPALGESQSDQLV